MAIGLAGLGVCLGEAFVARKALNILGKNPELSGTLMVYTILGIALVESAAIYGLIVALNIVGNVDLSWMQAVGAGLAIGLAGLGAGLGEGRVAKSALGAFHRNPAIKGQVLTFMILFIALVESAAIYGADHRAEHFGIEILWRKIEEEI